MTSQQRAPESLEATIRRVHADSISVGATLTPRRLAQAIAAQGWTHKRAPVTTGAKQDRDDLVTTEGNHRNG